MMKKTLAIVSRPLPFERSASLVVPLFINHAREFFMPHCGRFIQLRTRGFCGRGGPDQPPLVARGGQSASS